MPQLVRCPICKTEVCWEGKAYRPFCSERCRLIDLGAWFKGRYRVPGEEPKPEAGEEDGSDEKESP